MSIEGQYLLQTDPEADCKESTGVDCMRKWKLGLLSVFILFAIIAFVSTLRLLFDHSPHLVVVLGLVAFLGVSLCNLWITQEVHILMMFLKHSRKSNFRQNRVKTTRLLRQEQSCLCESSGWKVSALCALRPGRRRGSRWTPPWSSSLTMSLLARERISN